MYNCRTSNSWDLDLALSATYFPASGLTYAIVYGCPSSTENSIIRRLSSVEGKAVHPLLIPGVIVEIELARHAGVVEKNINEVEAKIFELDSQPNVMQKLERAEIESRNEAKRSAWLDLTYLRNSLQTWNAQLRTMSDHVNELERHVFSGPLCSAQQACDGWKCREPAVRRSRSQSCANSRPTSLLSVAFHEVLVGEAGKMVSADEYFRKRQSELDFWSTLSQFGNKIRRRLDTIQIEYDERIRDCTMRIDGMAMATQWVSDPKSLLNR